MDLTIRVLLQFATTQLQAVTDSPQHEAALLLSHVLQKPKSFLWAWPEYEVNAAEKDNFLNLVARRAQSVPIAYLIGTQGFWSLTLKVNEATLIPRPETETLVQLALDRLPSPTAFVLDLGTGCGAIALAIATERPRVNLIALDKSQAAIDCARENAARLNIATIQFRVSDWFSAISTAQLFDMIVANPPYIAADDPHLSAAVFDHEPKTALIAEKGGYADLRDIIAQAKAYLKPGGSLLLEHGWKQGEGVRNYFAEAGYRDIQTHRDLNGHERVSLAIFVSV